MKCTIKEINKLIEQVRSGQPPELPNGTREQHYYDPALPGFYIRLLNTGVASWTVQWKSFGRQKKIALGNVRIVDRPDAINAGRKLLAKVTLDRLDPHEARRERMRAVKVTFATVAPPYLEYKKRRGELRSGSVLYWNRYLVGYYFKPLHNLPLDEITGEQIQTCIDNIAIQSGDTAAIQCRSAINGVFSWALKTRKLPEGHPNPVTNVQAPAGNKARDRVLTDDEIRLIWKTCEVWEALAIREQQTMTLTGKRPSGRPKIADNSIAVRLLFLTGCRAQEIGDLQWSEIDLDNGELKISAERMKNAEILFNPLSDWAVQILRGVEKRPGRDCVFGHTKRPGKGQNMAATNRKINKLITQTGGTPPKSWRLHDIRRTFRTRLAGLGVSKDVGEALIGHTGHRSQVEEVYDLYERWPEKRQALAMWEANLRAIIDGTAEKIARPRFGEPKKGGDAA